MTNARLIVIGVVLACSGLLVSDDLLALGLMTLGVAVIMLVAFRVAIERGPTE